MNPVHSLQSYIFAINFNVILDYTPGSAMYELFGCEAVNFGQYALAFLWKVGT
jgi:hypothetical protein